MAVKKWREVKSTSTTTDREVAPENILKVIRCNCKESRNQCETNRCSCRKNGLPCFTTCGKCHGEDNFV